MRIHRIREEHLVGSEAEYRAKHTAAITRLKRYGHDVDLGDSDKRLTAYVSHGRWVADCAGADCNSGVALDPDMDVALCFGCGVRYTAVKWPRGRARIESVLLLRPRLEQQNWTTESVRELEAENIRHGVTELPSALSEDDG